MNRMRRIAGMGKTSKVPSAVQKDKDESIVFFRELYKHEKDTDVNLLEPIYSVEFDAIQGGHMSKPPPGKRDLLIPIKEKHDYDWPKTPPVAAPMFPSLKMEANSSETQHVKKPSSSRLIGKTQGTKTSVKPASPPTSKNLFRGAPSISNDAVDKRSACVNVPNRQQKPDAATAKHTSGASGKAHSNMYYASASTAKMVESPAEVYTAPKNQLTTGRARSRGPPLGVESGGARRPPCPSAAVARGTKELQVDGSTKNDLPAKGKTVASTGTIKTVPAKGMLRRADGKNQRRPRFADQ